MLELWEILLTKNEQRRRDCSLFSIAVHFPKLDVAPSIPISRTFRWSAGFDGRSVGDAGPALFEGAPEDSTVTSPLVFRVATDRKVRVVGQSCKSIKKTAGFRPRHFRFVSSGKSLPARGIVPCSRGCNQSGTRREIRSHTSNQLSDA